MSSTLCVRKTPERKKDEWRFKLPVKGMIAGRFYGHDGTCGGELMTIGPDQLDWFEGVLVGFAWASSDLEERKKFERIIQILRDGGTIDMWFEV